MICGTEFESELTENVDNSEHTCTHTQQQQQLCAH